VARFAGYRVADEPNADLSKVVWPSFVTDAKPEVKTLYGFQLTAGDLMRYMPLRLRVRQERWPQEQPRLLRTAGEPRRQRDTRLDGAYLRGLSGRHP
jgi:hypothetical protein